MAIALALLFASAPARPARAQPDPRMVLAQVILQLQTGTPNPQWYGMQLWQTIAAQTGNTGVYLNLRQLGPVTNVVVASTVPLPTGVLYGMIAQHQSGWSTWVIGVSSVTNRIEYATFEIGNSPQALPQGPAQGPAQSPSPPAGLPQTGPPQTGPPPNPAPAPPQGGTSDACRKFPNLC